MSLGKRDIVKNISAKSHLSKFESKAILECFIDILKNTDNYKKVKISKFGTFYMHKTPQRIGRNPKTKESYTISMRKKLAFRASNIIKKTLN